MTNITDAAAYRAEAGRCWPNQGMDCGSENRTTLPRVNAPRVKVSPQNATTLAICTGVRPQWEYNRKRTAPPDSAANPRLWASAYAQNDANATRRYGTRQPA